MFIDTRTWETEFKKLTRTAINYLFYKQNKTRFVVKLIIKSISFQK